MLNPYLSNINTKQEKYNVHRSAAQRALLGWPIDSDFGERVKDPKKDNGPIPEVLAPAAPRVSSRTMPGTTPMKTSGF